MATNTAGTVAREYHTAQIHYLRKDFTFADDGSTLIMGIIPAGSIVIEAGVVVSTAFNAGSTNVLDIGTVADPDGFATDYALGTVGVIKDDSAIATSDDAYVTVDTTIVCVVDLTGTAATTGVGHAWVAYLPNLG
jgi:hypothetical protein